MVVAQPQQTSGVLDHNATDKLYLSTGLAV